MPNVVKSDHEVELIQRHGIKVRSLNDIVASLAEGDFPVKSAAGADLIDLIHMGAQTKGG